MHKRGTFQIEKQIDHRDSHTNPQMMNEIFLFKNGDEEAKRIAEGHGYKTEQKGIVSILGINEFDRSIEYSIDGEVYKYNY